MKKLLAFVMFSVCLSVNAVEIDPSKVITLNKPMKCAPAQEFLELFAINFGEKPAWVGKEENSNSYISLLANKDTGTWTMIQYDVGIACVLGSGKSGTPI